MREIQIDAGLCEFSLGGAATVSFNPSDIAFVKRLVDAFSSCADKQDDYGKQSKTLENPSEIFELADNLDKELRETIDGVFGVQVCDPLFGTMNLTALSDGLPLWSNLILNIFDECDSSVTAELGKTEPRLSRYAQKYAKYKRGPATGAPTAGK